MRFVFICFWLQLFQVVPSVAQQPYARVDSIMRAYHLKVKSQEDLWRLSYFIRHNFKNDSLRLRAAFIWITENIEYDIKAFLNEDPRAAKLDYVLRKKKAVCSGYASLLKYFCDAYSIENEIVEGRARGLLSDVHITNFRFRTNHAWNAVKINNQWRLIDPTWASGGVFIDEEGVKKPKYYKGYNEYYYFTPPKRFALNHYPKDLHLSFSSTMPTYKEFVQSPLFTTQYLVNDIQVFSPDLAFIETRVGDTLTFRFKANSLIQNVHFHSKREKASYNVNSKEAEEWYEVKYPVMASGMYNLELAFNDEKISSVIYKIKANSRY